MSPLGKVGIGQLRKSRQLLLMMYIEIQLRHAGSLPKPDVPLRLANTSCH